MEETAIRQAYKDIEDNWEGQLDWVDDDEFTFALSSYSDGDDIGEVTDWMNDIAKEYGLKVDSSHDGHYVFWKEHMVSESKKKIMWAINFRNMSTAIHGLYYGKDRKRVEAFADEIEYIQKNDDWDWDEKQFAWENLMEEFPDISTLDEFDFHDIVDLPGGYEGIEDDDTIYRFVNRVSMDIYEEQKMTDWETGEQDYEDEQEFKADQQFFSDKDKSEKEMLAGKTMKKEAGKKVIPAANGCSIHDMGDCWVVTNKNGLNIGQCRTLIEAEDIAENADERTRMKLGLESTGKQKMKFKKIVKEADDGDNYNGDTPKIYVGTYAKYNDGSLDGKWVDLTEYDTYEDFLAAMHELHSDEDDPEFMVQDFENFPEKWYHEGGLPTEEEFNKINDYYMMGDDRKEAYEAYVNYTGDDDFDNFQDAYQGHFDSPTDFAYDIVESLGWDGIGQDNISMYFDYDSFGRDLMYDFHIGDPDNTDSEGNPEDPDHYYDNDGYDEGEYESDTQVAEDYVDNLGGVDQLGQETLQNYFDYEAYGRDLLINDYFEEDGYIFRRY